MKRLFKIIFVTVSTLTVLFDYQLTLFGEESEVLSLKEQKELFDRFKFPDILRREEIAVSLHFIAWHLDVIKNDNWQEATRHPGLYKKGRDLTNVNLRFTFFRDSNKRLYTRNVEYRINTINGSRRSTDALDDTRLSVNSDGTLITSHSRNLGISYNEKGKLDEVYVAAFAIVKLKENGRVKLLVKEHGVVDGIIDKIADKKIFDTEFHEWRKNFFYFSDDLKSSMRSKKTIPAVTLDAGKDYKVQIPDNLDRDTRSKFFKMNRVYETLKSGQLKKIIEDMKFDRDDEFEGSIEFRFEGNHLYDVMIVDGYGRFGAYATFDDKARIMMWIAGDMYDFDESLEGIHDASKPKSNRCRINGDGVEIYFHPTGHPKSYRTIIVNRLFGRQIEWDEKGKILSNVELDFPKPYYKNLPEEE